MPPTKGQGRGAGGSGSQWRRGRARAPISRPTPAVTTRSRAAQAERSPSPQSGKGDEVKSSKRAKKTSARSQEDADAGSASAVSSQEEDTAAVASSTAAAAQEDEEEDTAAIASPTAAADDAQVVSDRASEEEGSAAAPDAAASDSDQVSSPLRQPYLPRAIKSQDEKRVVHEPLDSASLCAYMDEKAKYKAKLDRQKKLLTLDNIGPITCLDDDESLLPVLESATQTVFETAKAVLRLTSSIDGNLLAECSGFFIDLDKETGRGTVLTSANLLCTKSPRVDAWSCPREYALDAHVLIHLLDDTIETGRLINYHKHYNIALFEVVVKISTELPVSTELVEYGQEVFLIGRDENLDLNACHGRVEHIDPGLFDHFHFMYVDCGVAEFGAGGPVIDTKGRVVGMANPTPRAAFIPNSFIRRCLRMWRDLKCVPRLHLGLKLSSFKFLRSFHREKISRKFNIDAGLIVEEVSEGSAAEKIGIRNGDVIESLNGECFSTVVELEIMLLRTCEHCLEKGGSLGSSVDLTVGLFQIRKEKRCTKKLTVNVSDDLEVIAEGTYPVTAEAALPN